MALFNDYSPYDWGKPQANTPQYGEYENPRYPGWMDMESTPQRGLISSPRGRDYFYGKYPNAPGAAYWGKSPTGIGIDIERRFRGKNIELYPRQQKKLPKEKPLSLYSDTMESLFNPLGDVNVPTAGRGTVSPEEIPSFTGAPYKQTPMMTVGEFIPGETSLYTGTPPYKGELPISPYKEQSPFVTAKGITPEVTGSPSVEKMFSSQLNKAFQERQPGEIDIYPRKKPTTIAEKVVPKDIAAEETKLLSDADRYKQMLDQIQKRGNIADISSSLFNAGIVLRESFRKPSEGFPTPILKTARFESTKPEEEAVLKGEVGKARSSARRMRESGGGTMEQLAMESSIIDKSLQAKAGIAGREIERQNLNTQVAIETANKQSLIDAEVKGKNIQKQMQENAMSGQIITQAVNALSETGRQSINRMSQIEYNKWIADILSEAKTKMGYQEYVTALTRGSLYKGFGGTSTTTQTKINKNGFI